MTKNKFIAIVMLSIVFLLVAGTVIFFFNQTLPPDLESFVEADSETELTVIDYFCFAAALSAAAANIGLLFFARWSRPVFAAGVVAATIATAFSGPFVATALEAFAYEAGLLLDGIIIALAYFSEAKVYFVQKTT